MLFDQWIHRKGGLFNSTFPKRYLVTVSNSLASLTKTSFRGFRNLATNRGGSFSLPSNTKLPRRKLIRLNLNWKVLRLHHPDEIVSPSGRFSGWGRQSSRPGKEQTPACSPLNFHPSLAGSRLLKPFLPRVAPWGDLEGILTRPVIF